MADNAVRPGRNHRLAGLDLNDARSETVYLHDPDAQHIANKSNGQGARDKLRIAFVEIKQSGKPGDKPNREERPGLPKLQGPGGRKQQGGEHCQGQQETQANFNLWLMC